MSIGNNIKKLRELKNYTQAYMSEKLNMSLSGYSKIERDETDISIKRLQQIAEVLETDCTTILDFDGNSIFNITQNQHSEGVQNAYTLIKNQQNIENKNTDKFIEFLLNENTYLKSLIEKFTLSGKDVLKG